MTFTGSPTQRRVLDAIAAGESAYGSDPGYNVMYGGGRFDSYADHPRQYMPIQSGPNAGKKSSAAGRYQFLASTWDENARELGLSDFSAESQDKAAWHLANKTYRAKTGRDLQADIDAGDTSRVAPALSGVWTSIPGGIEPNKATNGFNSRLQGGPMDMAFAAAPQRNLTPEQLAALQAAQANAPQAQPPGALSADTVTGGPGAFFSGLMPENMGDVGNRMQNAGAFLQSINSPGALGLVGTNNKIDAERAMAKAKAAKQTAQWQPIKDAAGNVVGQVNSVTGERKADPTALSPKDREEAKVKSDAKAGLSDMLTGMTNDYLELDRRGAIINPDRGGMANLSASAASSGPGQMVSQALGTEAQSIRQRINNMQPLLLSSAMQASGMSAQQLNSNVEFNFYKQLATDPSKDIYSNLAAIDLIDKKFGGGTGVLQKTLPPDVYKRVQEMSGSLRPPQSSDGGLPKGVRSIQQIN